MTSSKSLWICSGTLIIWFRPKDLGNSFTEVILLRGTRASVGGGASGFWTGLLGARGSKGAGPDGAVVVAAEGEGEDDGEGVVAGAGRDRLAPLVRDPEGGGGPGSLPVRGCRSASSRMMRVEWNWAERGERSGSAMEAGRLRATAVKVRFAKAFRCDCRAGALSHMTGEA